MKQTISVFGAIAILTIAVAVFMQPWASVTAESQRTISVFSYRIADTDSADGVECFPWGFVDLTLDVEPFRQVIVTDHRGDIGGVVDLQVGELGTRDNGTRYCGFLAELVIDESSFYTFTIDGKYRRTVSVEALEGMDWQLSIHLL